MAKIQALLCGGLLVLAVGVVPMTMTGCNGGNDAGDSMEQAGENAKDAAQNTGEAAKDATQDAADNVKDATN